jgi:leucyl-tRNA synthetase
LLVRLAHQTLKRVTSDFDARWHFNTSVALIMELVNELSAQEPLDQEMSPAILKTVLSILIAMLSPITPHICEELWEMLGHSGGLGKQSWPRYNDELAREEQIEIVVQVNGKARVKFLVDAGLGDQDVLDRAKGDDRIKTLLDGKQIVKTISVQNKLVNFVVK